MFKFYKYKYCDNVKSTLEDPYNYGCKHNGVGGEPNDPGMRKIPNQANSDFGDMYDQWRAELGHFDPNNRLWREQYMEYGLGPHFASKSYHCPPAWMDKTGTMKVTEKDKYGKSVTKVVQIPGLCGTDIPVCQGQSGEELPNPVATDGVDDYYDQLNEGFFTSNCAITYGNLFLLLVIAFLIYYFAFKKGTVANLPATVVSGAKNAASKVVSGSKSAVKGVQSMVSK